MQRATLEISWPAGGVSGERESESVVGSQVFNGLAGATAGKSNGSTTGRLAPLLISRQ